MNAYFHCKWNLSYIVFFFIRSGIDKLGSSGGIWLTARFCKKSFIETETLIC